MREQIKPMILRLIFIVGLSMTQIVSATAQSPEIKVESPRAAAIQALGLSSIPGRMQTFYSPRAAKRAKYLQQLLGGEIDYFSATFHVRLTPIAMAVLNPEQWPKIVGDDPYGMPSVDGTHPSVFVMPASWGPVTWMPLPKREKVPPAILARAMAGGKTWERIQFEGCDGIGAHEIGHTIVHQLGIEAQTHWLNEFLASYVGYAYLKAKQPDQVLSNEIFWAQGLDVPHPYTKLADFESKYDELMQKHPANYSWFQVALDQRVIDVFRDSGIDFLRSIQASFPKNGPVLTSAEVLDKLETLSGGWKAWSTRLEAGDVPKAAVSMGAPLRAADLLTSVPAYHQSWN